MYNIVNRTCFGYFSVSKDVWFGFDEYSCAGWGMVDGTLEEFLMQ